MLTSVWSDILYATRTLRGSRGFALMAIAPIALGVGINTGIFSILESVAFQPLPTRDSGRLVSIHQQLRGVRGRFISGSPSMLSMPEFQRYRDRARTLSGIAAHSRPRRVTLGGDSPREIEGELVTCNYFDVLQATPAIGPGFALDCDAAGAPPTVILSHDLWAAAFGGDPGIVGRSITINRQAFAVVGIAPEGFSGSDVVKSAFFAPASTLDLLRPDERSYRDADTSWLSAIGRLSDDAGIEQVRAELAVIAADIDRQQPGRVTTVAVTPATVLSLPEARGDVFAATAVVLVAFGLILLIACANVANLLLARGAARRHEMAVRLALGASRGRLVQQLLTETMLIALAGGLAGTILAWWSFESLLPVVLSLLPEMIPALAVDARPNLAAWGFALGLTVITGLVFGLAPALHLSKPGVQGPIKEATGGSVRRTGWLRGALMGVQVAVCMTLLISAGLMLRALYSAQTIDPGFTYRDVTAISFDLSGYDDEKAAAFHAQLTERLRALPGIDSVAQVNRMPLSPGRTGVVFRLASADQWHEIDLNVVSRDYFSLVGIPIIDGRTFLPTDSDDVAHAAIITEATARRYWGAQDPVGETMVVAFGEDQQFPLEIVGVARDAQLSQVGRIDSSYVYLPPVPRSQRTLKLLVRSQAGFSAIAPFVRTAIGQLDPGLAVRIAPLERNLDFWRTIARLVGSLSASLGLLALALASIGVYGVVSFVVSRRLREMAIRIALGATGREIRTMILRQTMRPVAAGMIVGAGAAAGASRVLESVLFGISPLDPAAFTGAALVLAIVATIASLVPTRRALRMDPQLTLRDE